MLQLFNIGEDFGFVFHQGALSWNYYFFKLNQVLMQLLKFRTFYLLDHQFDSV